MLQNFAVCRVCVASSDFVSRSADQLKLRRRQLLAVVVAREEVAVGVHGEGHREVTDPLLHNLARQFEAAVGFTIDAPGCVKVAERVQAAVFRLDDRLAILIPDWLAVLVQPRNRQTRCNDHRCSARTMFL